MKALGMFEAKSMTALITASDAMTKAANVTLVGYEKTGGGWVTAIIRGDVAAVKTAIEAGSATLRDTSIECRVHVIAKPHEDLEQVFPLGHPIEIKK